MLCLTKSAPSQRTCLVPEGSLAAVALAAPTGATDVGPRRQPQEQAAVCRSQPRPNVGGQAACIDQTSRALAAPRTPTRARLRAKEGTPGVSPGHKRRTDCRPSRAKRLLGPRFPMAGAMGYLLSPPLGASTTSGAGAQPTVRSGASSKHLRSAGATHRQRRGAAIVDLHVMAVRGSPW